MYAFSIWSYLEFQKTRGFKKWGRHCRFYQFKLHPLDTRMLKIAVKDLHLKFQFG